MVKDVDFITEFGFCRTIYWNFIRFGPSPKKLCEENLDCETLMLVVDYQQNLSIELSESTTTTVFGGNVVQIAQFPAVVFFRRSMESTVEKASITFFSDDLGHDHQQGKN